MSTATAPPPVKTGLFRNLTRAEYDAIPAIRASQLKPYATSARRGVFAGDNPPEGPALELGTAVHAGLLECKTIADTHAVGGPINENTGKPYGADTNKFAEWAATQDKPVLSQGQADTLQKVVDGVKSCPDAVKQLAAHPLREVAVVWTDPETGMTFKALCDALAVKDKKVVGLLDLKTCGKRLSIKRVETEIIERGYDLQLAFYTDGLRALGHPVTAVRAIFASTTEECDAMVGLFDAEVLDRGRLEYRKALGAMLAAKDGRVTGAYPDEVQLSVPVWAQTSTLDMDGLEVEND